MIASASTSSALRMSSLTTSSRQLAWGGAPFAACQADAGLYLADRIETRPPSMTSVELIRMILPLNSLNSYLTGGEASDSRNFEVLLDLGPDVDPRAVVADKGYDAKTNREAARNRGICPVIPYRSNTIDKPKFSSASNVSRSAARRRQQTMHHSSHSSADSS
jgi:hypothetical protein